MGRGKSEGSRKRTGGCRKEVGSGQKDVGNGGEVRSYHDITPLLCRYVSERRRASSTSKGTRGTLSGGGVRGIRMLEVEFLDHCWGMDFSMGEPHVIQV